MERAIAVIPARGGSKGIQRKNLMEFCGRPLLAWSILQAGAAQNIEAVYVSSDDREILETAKRYGAAGILRPEELATDEASSESALIHALDEIEKTDETNFSLVVFLQATSPLREPGDIDCAVGRLVETDSDSLFSAAVLNDFCLWHREGGRLKGLSFDPNNRVRRQDREPLYLENGSIYVFRPKILREHRNRLGGKISTYEMPFWKSYEIDTPEELETCKYYFERHLLHCWQKAEETEYGNGSLCYCRNRDQS
ncbi:MAG: acylneuraminate cytidylyltransferase family protein [Pseudomonadota bacterium]